MAAAMLTGRLSARFAQTDRGVVARWGSTAALELRGPFPGGIDAMPRYFLRNVTAGALEGDQYEIDIAAERGVRVRVEPTSAQKVFVSRDTGARLVTRLAVAEGARLDYDAGVTILHAGAALDQTTTVALTGDAVLAYTEVIAAGRLARGERFAFERLRSALDVYRDGTRVLSRHSDLRPALHRDALETAMDSAGAIGTLLVVGVNPALASTLALDAAEVYAGASTLPYGAGVIVQALAARVEQATASLDAARALLLAPSVSVEVSAPA